MDRAEFKQLLGAYDRSDITMPLDDAKYRTLRHPVTSELKFMVQADGIYEKQYEYDQFGEVYTEYSHKVMSKDAFIEAFERYVKYGE
jgi:uncharacterized protein YabN with tetrapyrrole methylase and pyrophosphatase domain